MGAFSYEGSSLASLLNDLQRWHQAGGMAGSDALVKQDAQGQWQPYSPPDPVEAARKLYEQTGIPDMMAGSQAFDRGEYLQALGQGAAGAASLAGMLPFGAATKGVRPLAEALDAAAAARGPIRAYHGSPHDFDAFDISKIGTGEGAQAYGHGLYFAESEPVAKSYRNDLSNGLDITIGGKQLIRRGELVGTTGNAHADELLVLHDGNVEQALRGMWMPDPDAIRTLRRLKGRVEAISPGKMYEVDLHADPARLLDWDRPLSEQGPQVQGAILAHPAVADSIEKQASVLGDKARNPSGQAAYAAMTGWRRGTDLSPPQERVAGALDYMRGAGIPGIRYLDQGSRGAGSGTSNYVVFDPSIIEILRKYGLAGLTAGAGAAALGGNANAAPFSLAPH